MKVLFSILKEMAAIPADPSVVASALTDLGLAVDEMMTVGSPVDGVVTARIVRMEKHPEAEKITRCWVDTGDGLERHVWCGATNMDVGDIVPLATIGTTMPDGRQIARREILGVASEGMLCSAAEIGVDEDASGLLILPGTTPLGVEPLRAMGIEEDVVFVLDLTRNRPDCWGHLGIARDLAAHFECEFTGPEVGTVAPGPARSVAVEIVDGDRCGLFSASVVSGVRVGDSPNWVKNRLSMLGMRPINNVVDASNLAMLELNQPNHAYDASVVGSFRIRLAREGEEITTLDGQRRTLSGEDLLICHGEDDSVVGLAGVMGDLHSEITSATETLLLESAWFSPDPIRFSALRHGLRTEASIRFERGTDPFGWSLCAQRFVAILRHSSPSAILHDAATVVTGRSCPGTRTQPLRTAQVVRTLGPAAQGLDHAAILDRIGFRSQASADGLQVTIPTWRPDCLDEIDLIEEIARHHGYSRLGKSQLLSPVHGTLSSFQARRRLLRRVLVGMGLDEAMPSPFLAPGELDAVGLNEGDALELENPLTSEESVLRTSLRPGVLKSLAYNLSHRARHVGLWEIGHVYPRSAGSLPDETEHLCVVVAGAGVEASIAQWNAISDALSLGAQIDQGRIPAGLHPTRSASLARGKIIVGAVGEVDPVVLDRLGIAGRVSILELNLSSLLLDEPRPPQAKAVNRQPTSDVDMAFVVPDEVAANVLQRALRQAAGVRLVGLDLFDVYRGEGVERGSRSLAFRLRLQERDGSVTDEVIANVIESCRKAAEKCGASLRA